MCRIAIRLTLYGVLWLSAPLQASRSADRPAPGTAAERVSKPVVLVIAHRGDSKEAPENTLPAFASAVKAGADLIELDFYSSADGIPVVCHDADLDRTTNAVALWGGAKQKITSKSLAELQALDAGSWFSAEFAGTRIPTLSAAMDTIQAGSMTLAERKQGDPAACLALLQRKKLLDRVVIQSFDWDFLAECHQLAPPLVLAALGNKKLTAERLDRIAQSGARIVAWEDKFTDEGTIVAIHARGWKAWVWTVDDPRRIGQLVQAKIDGIITNRPTETRTSVEAARRGR
jgi:glycerophosphoryl diester phosphodiesterase